MSQKHQILQTRSVGRCMRSLSVKLSKTSFFARMGQYYKLILAAERVKGVYIKINSINYLFEKYTEKPTAFCSIYYDNNALYYETFLIMITVNFFLVKFYLVFLSSSYNIFFFCIGCFCY